MSRFFYYIYLLNKSDMKFVDFKNNIIEGKKKNSSQYTNVDINNLKGQDFTFYGVILDAILKYLKSNPNANITLSNLTTDGKTSTINISGNDATNLKTYLLGETFKKDYGAKDLGNNIVQMLVTKATTTDVNSENNKSSEEAQDAKIRSSIFGKLKPFVDITTKQVGSKLGSLSENYLNEEINRIKKLMK
jgi:hypothetical protein